MTILTPTEIRNNANSRFPDNLVGAISAFNSRQQSIDMVDSWDALKLDVADVGIAQFNADTIQDIPVNPTAPIDKQVLVYDSGAGEWAPSNLPKEYGLIGFVDNAVATTIVVGTPVKVDPATFTSYELVDFAQSTNGRLTYTGSTTRKFHIQGSVSMFSANNNNELILYLAKNGTEINATKATQFTSTGQPRETTAFFIEELVTNDYIELFIENATASSNITVQDAKLMALSL
jgi:hypothetical protein